MSFGFFRTFSDNIYTHKDTQDSLGIAMKKQLTVIGIIGILLAVGLSGCFEEKTSEYMPTNLKDVIITLERRGCDGQCPVYKLTIYGNGTVIYDGYYFVNVTGKHITNISEGKIRELISEFEKIDYFSLNDSYSSDIIGLGSAITSISINGKIKTINHQFGVFGLPKELTELEYKIDEIVNSSQWIDKKEEVAEDNNETFTVYTESQEEPYNITVYNVSVPLDESEAMTVFEAIMGYKPHGMWFNINETYNGWIIQSGECLPIGGEGVVIMHINQENRTANVTGFSCI